MARFSKAALLKDLDRMIEQRNERDKFTRETGYSQVVGMGEKLNREYGEWDILRFVRGAIESGMIGVGE